MKKKILPYLLLTPMILIMGVLVFYPIAATFSYSLKYWKLTAPNDVHFIGFDNYINILKSESFWYSLQNTVFLLVLILFGTTILGVLLSLFLNIEVKFSGVLLAVAVLPWALPPYVNGILWRFIFYPGYGLMNNLIKNIDRCHRSGCHSDSNKRKHQRERDPPKNIWNICAIDFCSFI